MYLLCCCSYKCCLCICKDYFFIVIGTHNSDNEVLPGDIVIPEGELIPLLFVFQIS